MGLEDMVNKEIEKNLVLSDVHVPYQDEDAVAIALQYIKDYKPDTIYVNGDVIDFYPLSTFDKSPDRKAGVAEEANDAKEFIARLRKAAGKTTRIVYLEGNHEQRLQRYLWRNPELNGIKICDKEVSVANLLNLALYDVEYVKTDGDYWGADTGHVEAGDAVIMHGDSRLNGASCSKYAGYSAKNTMMGIQKSVVMGHVHRLAVIKQRSPHGRMTGVETGCLCQIPGNANWQQGFTTFETIEGKNINYKLHEITDGVMWDDGFAYVAEE